MPRGGDGGVHDLDEYESSDQPMQGGRGGVAASRKMAKDDSNGSHKHNSSSGGFKLRLFRVFYWITKERNTSFVLAITLIMTLFIQIFDLLISPLMKLPFKGSLYEEISQIFDVVRIYPLVTRHGGREVYWIFMFGIFALCLIYLIMLGIIDSSLKANRNKSVHLVMTLRIL